MPEEIFEMISLKISDIKDFKDNQDDFNLLLKAGFFSNTKGEWYIYRENGKIKELSLKEEKVSKGKLSTENHS
jgi:hypothetical protein